MTGYEISGFDKIPDEGPALLVYYHGALPIDLYYLMANVILHKRRCLRAVGDRFLFIIPGFLFTLLVMTSFCLCCILYKLSLFCGTLQNIVIVGFIQNYSAYFLFFVVFAVSEHLSSKFVMSKCQTSQRQQAQNNLARVMLSASAVVAQIQRCC